MATASVLDMTEAYATLANHGKHGTYTLVEKVTKDGRGRRPARSAAPKQAVSREAADTTTSILRSVVDGGTGTAAQAAGRPAAGKTGTAEEDKAAWFAGYTPNLATVVAVMGQDPDTGRAEAAVRRARARAGSTAAATRPQIWGQYTKAALKGSPVDDFDLELEEGRPDEAQPGAVPGRHGGTARPARSRPPGPPTTAGRRRSEPRAACTTEPGRPTMPTPTDGLPPTRRHDRCGDGGLPAAGDSGRGAAARAALDGPPERDRAPAGRRAAARRLQVQAGRVLRALQPLRGHRVQIPLPHQHVRHAAHLDLGTVLRVVQHPVPRLHGPHVLPHGDHLGPGQPAADRRGRRE